MVRIRICLSRGYSQNTVCPRCSYIRETLPPFFVEHEKHGLGWCNDRVASLAQRRQVTLFWLVLRVVLLVTTMPQARTYSSSCTGCMVCSLQLAVYTANNLRGAPDPSTSPQNELLSFWKSDRALVRFISLVRTPRPITPNVLYCYAWASVYVILQSKHCIHAVGNRPISQSVL